MYKAAVKQHYEDATHTKWRKQ